jgi:Tol biopolymer transport system component
MPTRAGAGLVLVALFALARARAARADAYVADEPAETLPTAPLPRAIWYTLETPHFDIHFYPTEQSFAERTAHIAERAYRLITRYLNWRPSGRVNITLNDQTDGANGLATSIPYTYIYAYGVPPDSLDELNDFDDYVKLLITHEFTHIVHLDTMLSPCALVLNTVMGRGYAPNLAQPTWFIEGMAVLMESRQTTAGRLRSSFFDMHLRVPYLEGRLFGLDQISAIPLAYPGGTAAYAYGSNLLRYIEDRYGPSKIREVSQRYADTCIPGGLNRTVAEAVGQGYVGIFGPGLWDDWKRSIAHRYTLQAEEARRRPLTAATRITWDAPSPRSEGPGARFFQDGTLVYHRANNDQSPAYVRLDPRTGARRLITDMQGSGPAVPTPDGQALIVQRINYLPLPLRISGNPELGWNDLFRFDLAAGTLRQLTRGTRAHEPDVSPDGSRIACALDGPGTRQLALVPITGGTPRILMPGAPGLAYTPAWSPDGRLIAYSRWKPGGFRDIHLYELATRTDRAISVDRAMDIDPRFSPDGRFVLFSSDRTGINDVYAYELGTRRLFQVTNVLSGAFQPVVSPDGQRLVYTGFTTDGFDLWTMPYDPSRFLPAQPYANARLDASADPDAETDSPDAAPEDAAAVPFAQRIVDYAPWKYMYPRQWSFEFLSQALGIGPTFQLDTSVGDPVGNHAVAFELLVPSNGDLSGYVSYSYNRLWPAFGITVARTDQVVKGLIVDGNNLDYRQRSENLTVSTDLPLLHTADAQGDLSIAYDYAAYGPVSRIPVGEPTGGITVKPAIGPYADLKLGWSFSDAHSWPYSISGQEGRNLHLNLRLSDPVLGGRFRTTEVSGSWTEYLTPPWAHLHALALLAAGGFGIGDTRDFFNLGGYAAQDVLRSVLLNQYQYAALRGYPSNFVSGDSYLQLTAEYRAPLVWIEHGYDTFPFYLRRIWGVVFSDLGNAFQGAFRPQDLKLDTGAEAHFEFNVAYALNAQVQLGYAHGFATGGGEQLYFVAAASY